MKKILFWVITCFLVLGSAMLAGCVRSEEAAAETPGNAKQAPASANEDAGGGEQSSASRGSAPGKRRITETVSDTFRVDLEIDAAEVAELPAVEAEPFHFELEKVQAALFSGQEPDVEKVEAPLPGYRLSSGDAVARFTSSARFSDLLYYTSYSEQVFDVFGFHDQEQGSIAAEFRATDTVPFAAPSEAETDFLDLLQNMGIGNAGDITVYALDHSALQRVGDGLAAEQEAQNGAEGKTRRQYKEEWTAADDCYYLIARCMVNDVPVSQQETVGPADEYAMNGSYAAALFNASGLQYLKVSAFVQNPVNGDPETILAAEEALDAVREKYGDLITENEVTVVGAELIYAPLPSGDGLELTPAWSFTMLEQWPAAEIEGQFIQNPPHEVYETVNAVTGAEFMASQGAWN